MKIMFADWTIAMAASNARQYDDNVWALDLTGELPEGWAWAALIAQGENLDIIELSPNEAGASAALTAAQLSLDGYYTIQIRGTKGDQVRHTNLVQVFIPRSLSGDATWPTLPTEFSQAEARIAAASAHPPIPGEDGYWQIWDVEAGEYKPSDTPVPGGDGGTDISLDLTGAAVGQIAKITEVDAEGKPTKWEPVDMPNGGVEDVQLNGSSIVQGGVAQIPIMSSGHLGIGWVAGGATSGLDVYRDGEIYIMNARETLMANRYGSYAIKFENYDKAVKHAMCDGKGAAWTDTERLAALLRLGCTVGDDGTVKWTAQEG